MVKKSFTNGEERLLPVLNEGSFEGALKACKYTQTQEHTDGQSGEHAISLQEL